MQLLCDLRILVDQSADPVASDHRGIRVGWCRGDRSLSGSAVMAWSWQLLSRSGGSCPCTGGGAQEESDRLVDDLPVEQVPAVLAGLGARERRAGERSWPPAWDTNHMRRTELFTAST